MSAFRRGIIKNTPSRPPITAIIVISSIDGRSPVPCAAHKKSAGSVNIEPEAIDSPAEPIVWTMLLSSTEFFPESIFITLIAMTAAGIDAETVIPTRSPR